MLKDTVAGGNALCGWERLERRVVMEIPLNLSIEIGRCQIMKATCLIQLKLHF